MNSSPRHKLHAKSISARGSIANEILDIKKCKVSSDLPPINPDFCLTRNNILEKDKKKRINSYLSQDIIKDVSHLLDSESLKVLPKTSDLFFENMFKTYSDSRNLPTGRIEVEQLGNWLKKMVETHVPELENVVSNNLVPDQDLVKKAEDIYSIALKELIKQVSVQSKLRGELIENVVESLKYIWKRYPIHLQQLLDREKSHAQKKIQEVQQCLKKSIENYKLKIKSQLAEIKILESEKHEFLKEISILRKSIMEYKSEITEYIQCNYKQIESIGIQTESEYQQETEVTVYERKYSRLNSIKDHGSRIQFNLLKVQCDETVETEDKSPMNLDKENFIIEFQKMLNGIEINSDVDINNLGETIYSQTGSLYDWVAGFRLGLNLPARTAVTPKSPLACQMTMPTPSLSDKNDERPELLNARKLKTLSFEPENLSSSRILKTLLNKSQARLQKYAKNTKKKIIKHINYSIYNSIGKKFSANFTFADLILQGFANKYNLRIIAERKFKEVIVGCIFNMTDNLRIRSFACALGCGCYNSYTNYSIYGTEIYIKLHESMIISKTGIIFDSSDPLEIEFYPFSRAIEVTKSLFYPIFIPKLYSTLTQTLKKLCETDSNHVNKDGVIRLDTFIETCMNSYKEYSDSIEQGVKFTVESITDFNYLTKGEVLVILRHLAPKKLGTIKQMNFDENDEINVEDFKETCLVFGLLHIETVNKFFENTEKNVKNVDKEIKKWDQVLEGEIGSEDGLDDEEFRIKLESIQYMLKGKRVERYFYLWHLLRAELEYSARRMMD